MGTRFMNSVLRFIYLFLIALVIHAFENLTYAQKQVLDWPYRLAANAYGASYNSSPISLGYILLKNGDTLKGRIKILVFSKIEFTYIPIVAMGKNEIKDIQNVQRRNIKYVRTYSDTIEYSNNFKDFINLDDKELWHLVAKKDSIIIYDNYLPGDTEIFGDDMILMSKSKKIKIYGNSIFHTNGVQPLLVRFINKRYKEKREITDFPDENAMLNYILTKESERNRNNPDP